MVKFIKSCLVLFLSLAISSGPVFAQEEGQSRKPQEKDKNPLPLIVLQDPPDIKLGTEYQFWIEEGNKAPYSGILLNPEATTFILSEYLAQKSRAEAALEKQRAADFSLYQLQVGKLEVELATANSKSELREKSKDSEIRRLQKINEDVRNDKSGFWDDLFLVGGSAGVGILIGIIGGFFIAKK